MEKYGFHEAANMFPMLPEHLLVELAEDIKANGLRLQITLHEGKILDGRNRYRACILAGVSPTFLNYGGGDPYLYVWSLNGQRRDLTADQRYLIWKAVNEQSEAWQQQKQAIQDAANKARSEAAKVQPRKEDGTLGKKLNEPVFPQPVGTPVRKDKNITVIAKAAASKTNRGTVERMDRLAKSRPDLAEKVRSGDLPGTAAVREMKQVELKEKFEEIVKKEVEVPTGEFDVIVIDPPWPMKKIDRDCAPEQVDFDYPTMNESELAALTIPAAKDCHVWVWSTHKFLPMALRLLDAWNLKYVCCFVWHKPGGFQPFGLPQYNNEFAIYARKGTPQFIDTKAFDTCFDAPRGAHSEKPEEFYKVLRRVTGGRRLDLFNRRKIEGFTGYGLESPQ